MIPIAKPQLDETELDRVSTVIESGMLADGPEVREFEREFAHYCETDYAVATSNGTTALHATIEALDLGDGDRVLTTPFSFVATANAVRLAGADPVFADIDPITYNLDPEATRRRVADDPIDAILVVHLYGLPAEMDAFLDLASELDVPLIEDAAQAHGASYRGKPVGSFGDAACFSFYPTKNMTTGEGGMVVTDRDDVATGVRQFINHGRAEGASTYAHDAVGHNFRMTSLAAAIGRSQLERLPDFVDRRRENAAQLTASIDDSELEVPVEPDHVRHAYHQYTVRTRDRDAFQDQLAEQGIDSAVYYPACIPNQPAYDGVDATVPVADRAASEVLSLPVHPGVSAADIDHITEVTTNYAR
ncbi:DegT/DnrJ/EryC1/StrS family aminotransferase [Natronosalvus vescus]|uniref:DegT/DnrJ/EryC1/StrS family aminotransferase n=1 Tax=Natronosalvus vescus TaxID=2953881 RepID=UPI002091994D|nr:DegT/DnrJ/EryC1/StrS family aminotransferase [Natronosalvus vescus]